MKIIDGIEFIDVENKMMGVSTGDANEVYKGIISLNKTAYRIWTYVKDGLSLEETAAKLTEEYSDLNYEEAYQNVKEFTEKLIKKGIITED